MEVWSYPSSSYILDWVKKSRDSARELARWLKQAGELTNQALIHPQKYGYELARPNIYLNYELLEFMVNGAGSADPKLQGLQDTEQPQDIQE